MILSDRSRLGAGLRLGCLVLLVLALMLLISLFHSVVASVPSAAAFGVVLVVL